MFENDQEHEPTLRASVAPATHQHLDTVCPHSDNVYRNTITNAPPPPPSLMRESAARERMRKRTTPTRNKGGEWAWVIIGAAMLGVVVMVSLSIFILLRMSREEVDILPTAAVALSALPTPVDFRSDGRGAQNRLVFNDGTTVELKPWDGKSRLTILLVGLDRRPTETGLGFRTDTMMLISINPENGEVGLLSIPRDLYVDFPNYYGTYRINEAMVYGELRSKGMGPQLAMETVQYNLAMRVHNYIIVDFQAFIGIVDAMGGIEVELDYNISDPTYPNMNYGYDPFYLRAGKHVLDGTNALKFARTRHGDNDFRRAERQQQTLYAMRDKLARPDTLAHMLTQTPLIWDSLKENVYTGLSLDQLIQIGLYLKDVPRDKIKTGVIDYQYSTPFTTSSGAAVLIPNRGRIATLMAEVFGQNYSQ